MEIKRRVGIPCPNEKCSKYGNKIRNNIIRFGAQKNGNPRYKCGACGKTFSKTKNTPFFYKQVKKEELITICKLLGKKVSFRGIARKTNKHLDTIRGLTDRIASSYKNSKDFYSKELKLSKKEMRAMWSFLKKKKNLS